METCPDHATLKEMKENEMGDSVWVCVSDEEGRWRFVSNLNHIIFFIFSLIHIVSHIYLILFVLCLYS